MTGESGAQADLGGFLIAHLAHQHDVRVLTQGGAQHAGEAQVDLGIDLHLIDPRQAVFHRVFHGDDLLLRAVQFGKPGIQRGGLTRTGRAGDQHHAIGALQQAAKARQQVGRHATGVQMEDPGALIQQTHHHRFAELYRHGRDPHIQAAVLHPDVEAAVLRQPLLGDIQAGHDLQAHHQRRSHPRLLHDLLAEHAIDTLTDAHHALIRLDVNVRGFHLHRILEQRLQQTHHRCLAGVVGAQLGKVEVAVLQLAFQLAGNRSDFAGAPVDQIEGGQELRLAHHRRQHAGLENALHLVEGEQVQRVGHADQQAAAFTGQDDGAETPRHGLGQALHEVLVELEVTQFDKGNLQLLGQGGEQLDLADQAHVDHRATELGTGAFLLLQRLLQLQFTDQAGLDQQVADAHLALADFLAHG